MIFKFNVRMVETMFLGTDDLNIKFDVLHYITLLQWTKSPKINIYHTTGLSSYNCTGIDNW